MLVETLKVTELGCQATSVVLLVVFCNTYCQIPGIADTCQEYCQYRYFWYYCQRCLKLWDQVSPWDVPGGKHGQSRLRKKDFPFSELAPESAPQDELRPQISEVLNAGSIGLCA
jgi:hypothetical protein